MGVIKNRKSFTLFFLRFLTRYYIKVSDLWSQNHENDVKTILDATLNPCDFMILYNCTIV